MASEHYAVRSISLPSRLHPNSLRIEAELNNLKAWEISSVTSTLPLSAETIHTGLTGLAELYNGVDELVHSPLTQQSLLHQPCKEMVEEALGQQIELLDLCGFSREVTMKMKEHVVDLRSSLRRKRGDSNARSNVNAYFCFRKKVTKDIGKCIGALKRWENKTGSCSAPLSDANNHLLVVIRVLKEVRLLTISIFRSLLLYLSMPVIKSRVLAVWSLISKRMAVGLLVPSEKESKCVNEVGRVELFSASSMKRGRRTKRSLICR